MASAWYLLATMIFVSVKCSQGVLSAEDIESIKSDPVSRANYGVMLQPIKTIYPAMSIWIHVFKLRMPPWVEHLRFSAAALCTREMKVDPDPPKAPCDDYYGHNDCQGRIEREPIANKPAAKPANDEYKCIIQHILIKKLR